jgi:DNA-binding response OmpR family regulator
MARAVDYELVVVFGAMRATVAIVEDEPDLREAVVEFLCARGLHAHGLHSATAFRGFLSQQPVDVVVLDIAMPGESGLSLARWLRTQSPTPAILFATASGRPTDRIFGLEIGADDYIVKPYDLHELLARIRSILRRPPRAPVAPRAAAKTRARIVPVGAFVLDLDARQVKRGDGSVISLTSAELELLEMLATRPHRIVTRSQILELSEGGFGGESARSIDVRIARLRKKLGADQSGHSLIRTIRGEGYMFAPE